MTHCAPQAELSSAESSSSAEPTPHDASETRTIVLLGNPNVGKTTLFNRLAGQNARVGNYPGVTVERRCAPLTLPTLDSSPRPSARSEARLELVDVPGTYSLSARSQEERIAIDAALGMDGHPRPALAVVVVDAGQLLRNLYLVMQLLELRVPAVIALNMIDETKAAPPNPEAIQEALGVPCVATNARDGVGLDELKRVIAEALRTPPAPAVHVTYPPDLRREIDRVAEALPAAWRGNVEHDRALALWAISSIDDDDELRNIPENLRATVRDVHASGRDIDLEVTTARYAYLDAQKERFFSADSGHRPTRHLSERVDRVLLHPVFGFVAFLGMMVLLFQSLFTWSDPAIGLIEDGVAALQGLVQRTLPPGILTDLVSEGVLGGVGNVVVFLPQILLLFLFIGLLEDSGYMARVAYLMDRIMKSLGLHGRAFVPMLSGFACAVPAILATRTMERQRDRLLTMMVVPLMTCSARLPVYTLVIGALFPPTSWLGLPVQGLLMVAMYLFSMVVALLAAGVLGRTAIVGKRVPLILELPPYRLPRLAETARMMAERAGQFLKEAGTVILACTVALWVLLSFPRTHAAAESPPAAAVAAQIAPAATPASDETALVAPSLEQSYGGRLGKLVEPLVRPIGFDWKLSTGIIGAFAAREVFVSTLGLVYGIGETDDEALPLRDKLRNERRPDGSAAYTPLIGLSLMVFFALACQCMSTLAVVKRETKSWRWPAFLFLYMTALAYGASFLVYQGGQLLGFAG